MSQQDQTSSNASTSNASTTTSSSTSGSSSDGSGVTVLKSVIAQPWVYYYPGEVLAPDEMRVTIMGSGMGNLTRQTQAACSIFVELGNGESFVFDLGQGTLTHYGTMLVPYSAMTKLFFTHLHMDHMTDLAPLYAFGPSGGRYTPLKIWGPSGQTPELGLNACLDGLKKFCHWQVISFSASQPVDRSYEIQATELPFRKNPGIAYDENGVTIKHWPALHIIDGAISYRLDWNGLSFVFSGDTNPNHFLAEHAKGADLLVHETFPTYQRFDQVYPGTTLEQFLEGPASAHTCALCLGKVLSLTRPNLGVTVHCVVDEQEVTSMVDEVRKNWQGPYQIGHDFMVINVNKDEIRVRMAAINAHGWGVSIGQPSYDEPALNIQDYQSPDIFDEEIKDCFPEEQTSST